MAGLAPYGTRGVGVAGALLAGVTLGVLWDRLRRYGLPVWLVAVLLAGFGATPGFGALAVSDLRGFAMVALFAVALAGMVRFAADGDTGGGFTCGLAMGAAVMCDVSAVLFTVMLAATCGGASKRKSIRSPSTLISTASSRAPSTSLLSKVSVKW